MAVRGFLDVASHEYLGGWAWDDARPDQAVALQVFVDGVPVARTVADMHRDDLAAAGIGNGGHGFRVDGTSLRLPRSGCDVAVRVDGSGEELAHSPARIDAAAEFDEAARLALTGLLAAPGSDDVLLERAQFLARAVDGLLDRVAQRPSGRAGRSVSERRRWRWRPSHGPAAGPAAPAFRALVIDGTLPDTSRQAVPAPVLSHMLSLQRLGYDITFVPSDMGPDAAPEPLAAWGIATACAPWVGSVEEVLRRQGGGWDLVYLHRVETASCYLPLVRHHAPRAKLVFSLPELRSLTLFRRAGVEDRPDLVPHGNFVRSQELAAAAASHAVLTRSAAEAGLLQQWLPQGNCHVVPSAVPVRPTPAPFEARRGLLLLAGSDHPAHLDAAHWLVDEIMPRVWAADPAIECVIAGKAAAVAAGAASGSATSRRDPRIRVDDGPGGAGGIDALLNQVRLTVAPLLFGAGLQREVGESLGAGVPCVCTPAAAEGYALPGPLQQAVAADAEMLAASIVRQHGSAEAFASCREAGLAYVAEAFSDARVDAAMRRAIGLPASAPSATPSDVAEVLARERPVAVGARPPRPAGRRTASA